jgi:hypothetical protein
MTISNQQLQERLRFDYKVAIGMRSPIMNIAAYHNADDLRARRNTIISEDEAHLATHYRADYYIRTLIGPDHYSECTSVHFDLLANNNYPFSEPSCWIIESQMPWSPVFLRGRPIALLFSEWHNAQGKMLFGHVLIRVAMLLNFDGLPPSSEYVGYNGEAVHYWRTYLNMRPINPQLPYPVLPEGVSIPLIENLLKKSQERRYKLKQRRYKFKQPLSVFLCHSHEDKPTVHDLYKRLRAEGLDPWLDKEKIFGGQDWRQETLKALRNSHAVIVCLSKESINKRGFVQNEIKQAIDVANEQPEGTNFLMPLKLEECKIPEQLSRWHCISLFEENGYKRLIDSLLIRANALEAERESPTAPNNSFNPTPR